MSSGENSACNYQCANKIHGNCNNHSKVLLLSAIILLALSFSLIAQLVTTLLEGYGPLLRPAAIAGLVLSIICILVRGKIAERHVDSRTGRPVSPYLILLDLILIVTLCLSSISLVIYV